MISIFNDDYDTSNTDDNDNKKDVDVYNDDDTN